MQKKTSSYDETISGRGFRFTEQRRQVFDAVMERRDHPTAVEVFMRVKERMPSISLATVYNCLETLSECGLVRHVNLDRAPSRYCANREDHGHFFCTACNVVIDVPMKKHTRNPEALPPNTIVTQREVSLRGLCPDCAAKSSTV